MIAFLHFLILTPFIFFFIFQVVTALNKRKTLKNLREGSILRIKGYNKEQAVTAKMILITDIINSKFICLKIISDIIQDDKIEVVVVNTKTFINWNIKIISFEEVSKQEYTYCERVIKEDDNKKVKRIY